MSSGSASNHGRDLKLRSMERAFNLQSFGTCPVTLKALETVAVEGSKVAYTHGEFRALKHK